MDEQFIGGVEEGRPGRGAESKALVITAVEVVRWFDTPKGKRKSLVNLYPPETVQRLRERYERDHA